MTTARIRVLFDTNVHVSYLLAASGIGSPLRRLFDLASSPALEFVVPEIVLREIREKVANKPALKARINAEDLQRFEASSQTFASIVPLRELSIPSISRDPDDDYIIAYALDVGVDYLVSGDKDLLSLGDSLAPLKIRSPQAFLDEVETTGPAAVD